MDATRDKGCHARACRQQRRCAQGCPALPETWLCENPQPA